MLPLVIDPAAAYVNEDGEISIDYVSVEWIRERGRMFTIPEFCMVMDEYGHTWVDIDVAVKSGWLQVTGRTLTLEQYEELIQKLEDGIDDDE